MLIRTGWKVCAFMRLTFPCLLTSPAPLPIPTRPPCSSHPGPKQPGTQHARSLISSLFLSHKLCSGPSFAHAIEYALSLGEAAWLAGWPACRLLLQHKILSPSHSLQILGGPNRRKKRGWKRTRKKSWREVLHPQNLAGLMISLHLYLTTATCLSLSTVSLSPPFSFWLSPSISCSLSLCSKPGSVESASP